MEVLILCQVKVIEYIQALKCTGYKSKNDISEPHTI